MTDIQSLQSQVTSVHLTSFIVLHNIPPPLYRELRSALSNPIFMRDGGVLGFSCHHVYVFDQLNTDTPLLKGVDCIVYLVAKSLGLSVMVKPIWSDSEREGEKKYLLSKFSDFELMDDARGIDYECDIVRDLTKQPTYSYKKITWCQKLTHWQPAGAAATGAGIVYGNQPMAEAYYQAASILVGIPKWGRKRRGYASIRPGGESQENSSEDEGSEDIDIEKFCFSPSAKVDNDIW